MPETNEAAAGTGDSVVDRLEDQINWYDAKSRKSQVMFKRAKVAEIFAAALIPFLAGVSFPYGKYITGGLGVLITILEGILHLNQYQQLWSTYRSTCEALKHEKYVYLVGAGPYTDAANARKMLAERIESLVSQEHAQWSSVQQQSQKAATSQQG